MVVLGDYIYFYFGCGGLQFVVIGVVGGVTMAECGRGMVAMAEAVLVVTRKRMRGKSRLVCCVVDVPWVVPWMVLWVMPWVCGGFVQVCGGLGDENKKE